MVGTWYISSQLLFLDFYIRSGHSLEDDRIGNQVSMLLIGHGFPDAAAGSVWGPASPSWEKGLHQVVDTDRHLAKSVEF